jgi:terminase large subunit-like protein
MKTGFSNNPPRKLQYFTGSLSIKPFDFSKGLPTATKVIERPDYGGDGIAFARAAGVEPDGWQAQLLRSSARQISLNCSRQAGKSTCTALLALHTALYVPDSLILLLAPALRQSMELFRKVKQYAAALNIPNGAIERETAIEIALAGGGRMVCLPGKEATVRGFSAATLLIVDEASRTPDDLYRAVRPMLAVSGGRIILLSSPYGKRGFFYEEWTNGGSAWERYEVPATSIPRIPPVFLAEERRALGERWYRQEYECSFEDTIDQVFATDVIMAARDDAIAPLW